MKDRPRVLVDMDGVLADFDGATARYLSTHPQDIPVRDRLHFYYRDDYPDSAHVEVIDQLHASQGFFRNLPLVEGASEGWQRIIDLGFHPQICSSPLHTNEWCADEKIAWIKHHLGRAAAKEAIIDSRKELYDAIALIDDRPEIKNANHASWQHIIFDTTYNQTIDTDLRLRGWHDSQLEELLHISLQRRSKT